MTANGDKKRVTKSKSRPSDDRRDPVLPEDVLQEMREELAPLARRHGLLMPTTDTEVQAHDQRVGPPPPLEAAFVEETTAEVLRRLRATATEGGASRLFRAAASFSQPKSELERELERLQDHETATPSVPSVQKKRKRRRK